MRISDWSSDVCSSGLFRRFHQRPDINEPGAGLTEGLRRLSRAEPIYGQSVLTNAHGERHEIAVAGHQAKPLDTPAEQQIHRVERHFHVGRVLALSQVELLLRFDGVAMDNLQDRKSTRLNSSY